MQLSLKKIEIYLGSFDSNFWTVQEGCVLSSLAHSIALCYMSSIDEWRIQNFAFSFFFSIATTTSEPRRRRRMMAYLTLLNEQRTMNWLWRY